MRALPAIDGSPTPSARGGRPRDATPRDGPGKKRGRGRKKKQRLMMMRKTPPRKKKMKRRRMMRKKRRAQKQQQQRRRCERCEC